MRCLASLMVLAACRSPAAPAAPAPAPEVASDTAPAGDIDDDTDDIIVAPPFTADDLRAGLPAGTEIRLRIEAAGEAPTIQHWVFTAADQRGCTIHARVLAEDGTLIRDEGTGTSTWDELVGHARFPAASTTRSDSSVDVPAGHFDTWLFVVEPDQPGAPRRRLHFARTLPGPPVFMEVIRDGTVVMKMELVSRTGPSSASTPP